ncbi:unnamed protein product [Periconia digitata]|uniref:Uncharacterized protein n=1 Tax=Periconia digitata TaxID=1303443 RepID=A0A9W4XJF4_9PLEO|nr:unnamed protein product [Periconia digitata]
MTLTTTTVNTNTRPTQTSPPTKQSNTPNRDDKTTTTTTTFLNRLCYEAYTIWLFTRSDLKTIVLPKSVFGILGAFTGSNLLSTGLSSQETLLRAPLVILWVWIVLLPCNIDNQYRARDIQEDGLNRPWRPLPAKRLSSSQAWRIMMVAHAVGLVYSWAVGGLREKVLGICFGWLYNGLGAAHRSCVARNFVNALGYVTFSMGAISVAASSEVTERGVRWFMLVGCVVFTMVHMQDLPDVRGDALRGRKTVPLVVGGRVCRWSIAVMVPFWTVVAVGFWEAAVSVTAVVSGVLAIVVAVRVLRTDDASQDAVTYRLWNLWMVTMYVLPIANGAGRME